MARTIPLRCTLKQAQSAVIKVVDLYLTVVVRISESLTHKLFDFQLKAVRPVKDALSEFISNLQLSPMFSRILLRVVAYQCYPLCSEGGHDLLKSVRSQSFFVGSLQKF